MTDQDPSTQATTRLGRHFVWVAWLIVLALLSWFFSEMLDRQRNPNQTVLTQVGVDGTREVHLTRNRAGHYITNGRINGRTVEFMIDTGATDVAIPMEIARGLGLKLGQARVYQTANGLITAYTTRIDELRIGDIVLRDVRASVSPANSGIGILLGMSVMKRLEFTQRGDTLTLRQLPTAP